MPTAHNTDRRLEPVGAHYDMVLDITKLAQTVPIGILPDDPMATKLVRLLKPWQYTN